MHCNCIIYGIYDTLNPIFRLNKYIFRRKHQVCTITSQANFKMSSDAIQVRVETVISPKPNPTEKNVARVTVVPPESGNRIQSVVIAMLDISGSMDTDASPPNDATGEAQGFSRLDLVKHSMNTVKEVMNDGDYLCIITFSNDARTDLPLTKMDDAGRKRAGDCITGLATEGSTNIWGALKLGVETTKDPICKGKNVVLVLLTDGEPNVFPPKGIVPTLKDTIQGLGDEADKFSIHAFGFGYNLDSLLLYNICTIGRGTYGFIPDCSMVGTIFINFMANTIATVIPSAKLRVEGGEVTQVFGRSEIEPAGKSKTTTIDLGSLQYGQSKTVLFEVQKPDQSGIRVSLDSFVKLSITDSVSTSSGSDQLAVDRYAVGILVEELKRIGSVKEYSSGASKKIGDVQKSIKKLPTSPFIEALLKDIESADDNEGQIMKAVSKQDWYKRWGQDHLLAFSRAHTLQQSTNFKDASIQLYGGQQFTTVQDETNTVFCSLPPPKPSCRRDNSGPVVRNMATFANSYGPCFDGEGLVQMANGEKKAVKTLKRGDQVASSNGGVATVLALIETPIPEGQLTDIVEVEGVSLTPWHPIQSGTNGQWVFPADVHSAKKVSIGAIYNLVLDSHHVVTINSLNVITLGHDKTEGILAHPYFGSEKVVADLKQHPGWASGHVVIENPKVERDANGLVCKFF